ncbi:hypothetical protein BUALT_Bualt19G0051600 [Buddleja alternifolia]|uniref:Uncharacterized protein n=1 Tax=Buddleja alternifolia TaxID=168488 RepID=A0AAV6W1N4_9LAMI|nr:hypothetical protein BUALT_Bualt19G0051600 [Buddleja alternifolia]
MSRRDNYDVYSTIEAEPHSNLQLDDRIPNRNEDVCWMRERVEGIIVDETITATEKVEAENDSWLRESKGPYGEVIEMKKKANRSKEQFTQNMSSSQLDAPRRPHTRAQQHIPNKLQEHNVLSRPQAHSQGLNQEQVISQSQTHATSSRVPCEANSTSKQTTTIKKGRGPARFPKIWGTGKQLEVTLDRKGKVIGPDVIPFKTALGVLARIGVKLPLNYVEFQYIPQYLRDMAWGEVEVRCLITFSSFLINTTLPPEAKSVVLSELNGIWRKWKHKIKEDYFIPHEDDEEYLSKLPTNRIELDQWLDLVKYWQDEEVQKIAAKNAENVGKTDCHHRTGRTPFAVLEHESRARGKGIGDDEDTSDLYNYFKQELSKKPESERTRVFKETLFKNAMGENNSRVRNLERRRKRAALAAFASTSFQQQGDKEDMQKFMNEMKEERERLEHMKDEFSREKEELLVEKEKMNNLTKKLEMLISQFPAISSAMTQNTQVPDASSSHGLASNGLANSLNPTSPEEQMQIVGGKSKKQKTMQDYYVNSIKIGKKKDQHVLVKVYVEKAMIPNEKLRRPHEGARTIGKVVHKCIYWEFVDVMEI